MEPEDAPEGAHGGEAVRVSTVRGDVQAEGSPLEALVFRAQERYLVERRQLGTIQLLLLPALVRVLAGADQALVRTTQ